MTMKAITEKDFEDIGHDEGTWYAIYDGYGVDFEVECEADNRAEAIETLIQLATDERARLRAADDAEYAASVSDGTDILETDYQDRKRRAGYAGLV